MATEDDFYVSQDKRMYGFDDLRIDDARELRQRNRSATEGAGRKDEARRGECDRKSKAGAGSSRKGNQSSSRSSGRGCQSRSARRERRLVRIPRNRRFEHIGERRFGGAAWHQRA